MLAFAQSTEEREMSIEKLKMQVRTKFAICFSRDPTLRFFIHYDFLLDGHVKLFCVFFYYGKLPKKKKNYGKIKFFLK